MNADRRKRISQAQALVDEARQLLEACRDEEQEYAEAIPESFTEKIDKAEGDAEILSDAVDSLTETYDHLGELA